MRDLSEYTRSKSCPELPKTDKNCGRRQKRGSHHLISQSLYRQDIALVSYDTFDPHVSRVICNADGRRQRVTTHLIDKVNMIDKEC